MEVTSSKWLLSNQFYHWLDSLSGPNWPCTSMAIVWPFNKEFFPYCVWQTGHTRHASGRSGSVSLASKVAWKVTICAPQGGPIPTIYKMRIGKLAEATTSVSIKLVCPISMQPKFLTHGKMPSIILLHPRSLEQKQPIKKNATYIYPYTKIKAKSAFCLPQAMPYHKIIRNLNTQNHSYTSVKTHILAVPTFKIHPESSYKRSTWNKMPHAHANPDWKSA